MTYPAADAATVPEEATGLALVHRYRQLAAFPQALPVAAPAPVPKRYPQSRRIPLPWPGAGGVHATGAGTAALGRVLLAFASTRLRYALPAHPPPRPDRPPAPPWVHLPTRVPSGGAQYPGELYLTWPGSDDLAAGLYHYDGLHHVLEQLAASVVLEQLAASVRERPAPGSPPAAGPTFLVTCRIWKNAAEYGDFGYRLGCLDVGALVGQLQVAYPGTMRAAFGFDQDRLDRALGVDPAVEASYAVVGPAGGYSLPEPGDRPDDSVADQLRVERQLADLVAPEVRALHRATSAWQAPAPAAPPPTAAPLPLPLPLPLPAVDVLAAVHRRRSAGAFRPCPVATSPLATVLRAAAAPLPADVPTEPPPLSVYCVATRVAGVPPGAYRYDPGTHTLVPGPAHDPARLAAALVRPAAAALFLAGEYQDGVAAAGPRWYRILHLLAGAAAQRAGVAAAGAGLGARTRLDFDVEAMDLLLGLPPGDTTLVQVVLGQPRPGPAAVDLDLV